MAPLSSGAAVTQVTVENCVVHHNNGGFKEGEPGVAMYHEGLTIEDVNFTRGVRNGIIEKCLLYSNALIN